MDRIADDCKGRIPETTLACIKYLRAVYPQAKVSVEVEKPGREGLGELATEADLVFFSKSWVEGQGYTTPRPFLEEQGDKLAARKYVLA
jgi:ketohexokinase